MILKHAGSTYVVVYNNSCCLHYSAGGQCRVQKCSYFHETAGPVMSGLPLSSPPPTVMTKNWLKAQELHTLVNQVQPGASSLIFTEQQGAIIDRMKQEGLEASNAALDNSLQREMNKREVDLRTAKADKEMTEIKVSELSLDELEALRVVRPFRVAPKRAFRKRNRQNYEERTEEQNVEVRSQQR